MIAYYISLYSNESIDYIYALDNIVFDSTYIAEKEMLLNEWGRHRGLLNLLINFNFNNCLFSS